MSSLKMMIAGIALASILAATPAFAHVTLETQEAAIGSTYKAVLRVPHGCGTEATIAIHVQIPEGFFAVKPMPHAGWDLKTVTGPYANSYDSNGTKVTEGVKEIIWSGGNLPNEFYDEFVFRGTFAGSLEEGPFYFPVVQTCAKGENAWIDTSGSEAGEPAPNVTLVKGN